MDSIPFLFKMPRLLRFFVRSGYILKMILFLFWINVGGVEACFKRMHTQHQNDFLTLWKDIRKTIYDGDSVQELLDLCPNGCADCPTFPVKRLANEPPIMSPCVEDDIVVLRTAQELVQGWKDVGESATQELVIHSIIVLIIIVLIIILIIRGHYRFKDLWFYPTTRQWEKESDPTWGLPGKVWSLLRIRVVKSSEKEPTERKHLSYTENPTTMGQKFWYYKQTLRNMYKTHKYYKRNRYFHKLAWQFTRLGQIIPETLRQHKTLKSRAGEVEKVSKEQTTTQENDSQNRLPWSVDLTDELNAVYLKKAKEVIAHEIEKEKGLKRFVNGRYQPSAQHYRHNRPNFMSLIQPPLTFEEVRKAAKDLDTDPNSEFVMVDGVMKIDPALKKAGHHHHHHHHSKKPAPASTQKKK